MRLTFRRAATATAVVGATFALAAGPAFAAVAAHSGDPYLPTDTTSPAATISGAGSSFAAPLQNTAIPAYSARNGNATINAYQAVGSGTGEADIIKAGSTGINWGGTDVPMGTADIAKNCSSGCPAITEFVQVPIGLGGVGISYNVPGVKTGLHLNATILADIYNGVITKWNAPQIKKLNPKFKLPAANIIPVFRSDSSGTSYIFTNFLQVATKSTTSSGVWPYAPTKNEINTYAHTPSYGVAAAHNGGVASAIANTKDSIGYVEYSYILLNKKLAGSVAAIQNGKGIYQSPTVGGIAADAALFPHVNATTFAIVFGKGKTAYPICGYTWAVVWRLQNASHTNTANNTVAAATGTLLVKYLDWLAHSGTSSTGKAGQDIAALDGYVPLPKNIQALATRTLVTVVGSANQKLI
jgi:phosphate transport system substrate-binding protein